MGIFKRVSDIISANLNDMADQYENPEKMLKQAILEMESSIEESRRSVAKAMASERLVAKSLNENQQLAKQWETRAEAAVEAGNDDLALKAINRRQEHEKLAAALSDQHAAASEACATLRRQLAGMQAKLAEGKRRLGTLTARKRAADVRAKTQLGMINPQLNNDAFAKFDRMREKVELAEAEADALRELSGESCSVAVEPEGCAESDPQFELEAELLEMKKRLKK